MRYRLPCLGIAAVVLAGSFAMSSQQDLNRSREDHASKVKVLLKQRHEVLSTRSEMVAVLANRGKLSQADLINARDDAAAAELELSLTQDRRIEVLKSRVENLKAGEEFFTSLKLQAKASEVDVLAATSRRLLAEIQLEQFQDSLNADPSR